MHATTLMLLLGLGFGSYRFGAEANGLWHLWKDRDFKAWKESAR